MKKYSVLIQDNYYIELVETSRTFKTKMGAKRCIKRLISIDRKPWEFGGHKVVVRKVKDVYTVYVDDKRMYKYTVIEAA